MSRDDKYISQNHLHEEREHEADLMSGGEGGRSISRTLVSWLADKNENRPGDKKDTAARRSLFRILEVLQNRHLDLSNRINDTAEKLNTLEELRDLYTNDQLDFENPEHLRMLDRLELTPEQIEAQGLKVFDNRQRELIQYMNYLEEAQEKLDSGVNDIMNSNLSDAEKQHQLDQLYDETDPEVLRQKAKAGPSGNEADQRFDQMENKNTHAELNLTAVDSVVSKFNASVLGEGLETSANDQQFNQEQPAAGADDFKP